MLWNFNFPVAKVVEVVVHSIKKKKKKKEALRRKGGMDFIWWAPVYYFWLQRLVKVVKSVKKDVESRVESKGLYRGIKVVFFFNF